MLCENCQQRPATLHFTKIINGQKNEYHLCEQCAKEKGEMFSYDDSGFSFNNLLSGLLNFDPIKNGHQVITSPDQLRCKTCGLTFSQFKKMGKFGCHDCYNYFEPQLEPIFRRIHGNSQHIGKVPHRSGENIKIKREIVQLKEQLQRKILAEEFEEAAKLRDQIKALESKLSERRG
ncbi:UvrB/UvrC motif-containing protein [Tepidibacillus fermentans]|uniref:Protein arginine kinase activator n=1 Tax=Tepidibacillus fermentans TaxID=1281767 RepID=A0A4V2USI5_9BACI|nr:UvrB/UvrC motif-containing protein [Tepidibacillus fermentans]TCS81582.1 protein arginine kinase activator [Tepidibacillus fermentans]